MKQDRIVQLVFFGVIALALALYALTVPSGLPWNDSTRLASAYLGETVPLRDMPHPTWGLYVQVFDSAILLSVVVTALAAGLLMLFVNRYFGWRVGAAAAITWLFLPWVWNRAITGQFGVCQVSVGVAGLWALGIALPLVGWMLGPVWRVIKRKFFRMQAETKKAQQKRLRINNLASWVVLELAGVFALVSLALHDYKLGEAASVYARGIVEAAKGRIIVGNGILDEQLLREAKGKSLVLCLREDDAYRRVVLETVKRECPADTNLWIAAQVGVKSFAEVAVRKFPDRFYLMSGSTSTVEDWERRWSAFSPYLGSSDPFVGAGRRLFGYEGNCLANVLAEKDAKTAWKIYRRIYDEVDPGNFSTLVNMSELIRRGYKATPEERKLVQDWLDAFLADASHMRNMREIARASGPVRADPQMIERFESAARQRIAERIAAGEDLEVSPEIMTLVDWNNEMVNAMNAGDIEKAGRIARMILANPDWHTYIPANAIMGTVAAREGDYVASERFFQLATHTTNEVPFIVWNDYAETLQHLGRQDEAEQMLRRAVAASDPTFWRARMGLAKMLVQKAGRTRRVTVVEKGETVERYVPAEDAEKLKAEIRALLSPVITHAPESVREEARKMLREVGR